MSPHKKKFEQKISSEKKYGKGRATFLKERSDEHSFRVPAYQNYLLRNGSKVIIQNQNGTHLITDPIIYQMKELVGDKYNGDINLKSLKSGPTSDFVDMNNVISYSSCKLKSSSSSSSLFSGSSGYEDLCKSLSLYDNKGNDLIKAIEEDSSMDLKWKTLNSVGSEFILKTEEFPALK